MLVLDADARHAVAAIRGLARSGWRVVAAGVEPRASAPAARSRQTSAYVRIPDPYGPAAPFAAALDRLVRREGVAAIVACYDGTIARLGSLGPIPPTVPRLDEPLLRIIDKGTLADVCRRAGVPYPATWLLADAPAPSREAPLIVKPRRTAVARDDLVASRTGASVATDARELSEAVEAVTGAALEPIAQRRVDRVFKVNVSLIRHAGRTTFEIAYRVVLEYPTHGGLAAMTETIEAGSGVGRAALDAAARVMDAAGYEGLGNVEFYGQADGSLCLIEVNARVWGSLWLPERLGLEPTSRAVEQVLGLPPRAPAAYPAGRRFHRPLLQLQWLASRSPERGPRRELFRRLRPGDVVDVVALDDPMPAVAMTMRLLATGARVAAGRLTRRRVNAD